MGVSQCILTEIGLLYEHNALLFLGIAYLHRKDIYKAEDTVQSAFLRILNRLDIFSNVPEPKRVSYISTAIRNQAIDDYRREHRFIANSIDWLESIPSKQDMEEEVLCREDMERTMEAVNQLPKTLRYPLLARCIYWYQYREIGQLMGISEVAARKRVQRARETLRRSI